MPGQPSPDPTVDPTLGEPCTDEGQCNDGIPCTVDTCDATLGRCRFVPDHSRCANGVYCDGEERCEPGVGCREGEPIACSDNDTCTIDRCVEETRSCESRPRDADGDGDPVWNCQGGTDCDDENPRISGLALERCGNGLDDDCDGDVDELRCVRPMFDNCLDPLLVEESGTYELSLAAADEDFVLSCASQGGLRRDVVAALVVPEGPPVDVDLTAVSESGALALALFGDCNDADSELLCAVGAPRRDGKGNVARTIARGLEPGAYPVVVSGLHDSAVTLTVGYATALPPPENETCETASVLVPGENVQVTLANASADLETACVAPTREPSTPGRLRFRPPQGVERVFSPGIVPEPALRQPAGPRAADVVFRFDLEETQDVTLSVAALDPWGEPVISLRDEACAPLAAELTCRAGSPSALFARALPAGTYFAVVAATGPSDVDVRLDLSAPSETPRGEGCDRPPELVPGQTEDVDLARRVDAVDAACLVGAPDATFALNLPERSDVLLVQRVSAEDVGAVSLLGPECAPETRLVCARGEFGPVRAVAYGVPEGEFRAVAESRQGSPLTLTAFVRPSAPTTLVGLSDWCGEADHIDEHGGRYVGSTQNALPDYEASCDFGGTRVGGAPDQILKLELSRKRRVVFDLGASDYDTLLVLREGGECPGREVPNTCVPGYGAARSFLDVVLDEGEYWVQIDGYDGAAGSWVLEVFTADP